MKHRVIWIGRRRLVIMKRVGRRYPFRRIVEKDGSQVIGLGRVGLARYSYGTHRVLAGQPLFKNGSLSG